MTESRRPPLGAWRFSGTLRDSQTDVLARLDPARDPLHVVAPPGSGKTLLGLLLAVKAGNRALVLAPTVTICEQWIRTARELAPESDAVADDVRRDADLTVLTYQLLSVTGDGAPFEGLARQLWAEELEEAGRTQADAETWLAELAVTGPSAYRSGIRRRVRTLRRRFAQQRPDQLARVLHPNAVAAMDALVAAGVQTIVLDECHHLLDHWALVVSYLRGRIRENGGTGLLIGLTATLPSPDDEAEFENYSQLLGAVDYEVPTPAVVKEGNLAPYRDHVLFTEPTPEEAGFIRHHEQLLHELVTRILSTSDGADFLIAQLQPAPEEEDEEPAARLERALAADFPLTRSCAVVLREIAPWDPLAQLLPPVLLDRCTTDDLLTVLARFAQARLLPDPDARGSWEYVRRTLQDFGYLLTDRGIRRGREPLESTLAFSASKDRAAVTILRDELSGPDAERIRAVVVTDFVEHGNRRGEEEAAGARRAFAVLAADAVTGSLRPVLLTAQQVRVRTADADRLGAALSALLGETVTTGDSEGDAVDLDVPGAGRGRIVAAVSELVRRGEVRLLVGTRGILGEGWDCPAINTLIDLTAVATSSATQQLRGRTLRRDPEWPEKVAHNWSVACLVPADVAVDDAAEPRRLQRKHGHLWGLDADDHRSIVTGLRGALPAASRAEFARVLAKDPESSIARINELTLSALPSRAQTRADWRIGEPYAAEEREAIVVRHVRTAPLLRAAPQTGVNAGGWFLGGTATAGAGVALLISNGAALAPAQGITIALACGAASALGANTPAFLRSLRDRRRPADVYRRAAVAVARTLQEARRIGPVPDGAIRAVRADGDRVRLEIAAADADRRVVADAVEELFAPVRNPRFLLRIGRGKAPRWSPFARIADRLSPGRTLLAVPRMIGRRRGDAERFRDHWAELVGSCTLHELDGVQGLALLRIARSASGRLDASEPRTRIWG